MNTDSHKDKIKEQLNIVSAFEYLITTESTYDKHFRPLIMSENALEDDKKTLARKLFKDTSRLKLARDAALLMLVGLKNSEGNIHQFSALNNKHLTKHGVLETSALNGSANSNTIMQSTDKSTAELRQIGGEIIKGAYRAEIKQYDAMQIPVDKLKAFFQAMQQLDINVLDPDMLHDMAYLFESVATIIQTIKSADEAVKAIPGEEAEFEQAMDGVLTEDKNEAVKVTTDTENKEQLAVPEAQPAQTPVQSDEIVNALDAENSQLKAQITAMQETITRLETELAAARHQATAAENKLKLAEKTKIQLPPPPPPTQNNVIAGAISPPPPPPPAIHGQVTNGAPPPPPPPFPPVAGAPAPHMSTAKTTDNTPKSSKQSPTMHDVFAAIRDGRPVLKTVAATEKKPDEVDTEPKHNDPLLEELKSKQQRGDATVSVDERLASQKTAKPELTKAQHQKLMSLKDAADKNTKTKLSDEYYSELDTVIRQAFPEMHGFDAFKAMGDRKKPNQQIYWLLHRVNDVFDFENKFSGMDAPSKNQATCKSVFEKELNKLTRSNRSTSPAKLLASKSITNTANTSGGEKTPEKAPNGNKDYNKLAERAQKTLVFSPPGTGSSTS